MTFFDTSKVNRWKEGGREFFAVESKPIAKKTYFSVKGGTRVLSLARTKRGE